MNRKHLALLAFLSSLICFSSVFSQETTKEIAQSKEVAQSNASIDIAVLSSQQQIISDQTQTMFLKVALKGKTIETKNRPRLNIALVIDRSSSMSGDRIIQAKIASKQVLDLLSTDDIFSLISYDNDAEVLVPATKIGNRHKIEKMIDALSPRGSTALYAGVQAGGTEIKKFFDQNQVNRVILLSDGQANIGPSSPSVLGDLGRELGSKGISVSTIGLGLGYNEDLMTQLAIQSDGNHAFVETPDQLSKFMSLTFGTALAVVGQQIELEVELPKGLKAIKTYGRNAKIEGQKVKTWMNQVISNYETYLLIEVEVQAQSQQNQMEIAQYRLKYQDSILKKEVAIIQNVYLPMAEKGSPVVENEDVKVDAIELQMNERNKEALELRDRGDVQAAKALLDRNSNEISGYQKKYKNAPKLKKLEESNLEDSKNIENEGEWQRSRKAMKKKQFSFDNQQAF